MNYRPLLLLVALLGLLSGCAVYDRAFHPHRLGNPPMTASAKAKAKAAEKARHKGLTLGAPAPDGSAKPAATDGTGAADEATAAPPAADAKSADDKNKAVADMLGNTYDTKTGLLKRSRLQRLQYSRRALHHYALSAPPHTDATRDARHLRKHPKGKGNAGGRETEPKEASAADPGFAPDPTQPAAAPAAKAAKSPPAKAPAPKAAKAPKAPKAPAPRPVKAVSAPPKAKVDKEAAARIKEEKLRAGGEHTERTAKPPKEKKKKDPKAPKPDPTQPLTGQD